MINVISFTNFFLRKMKNEIIKNGKSFPSVPSMKLFLNSFIYSTIQSVISIIFPAKELNLSYLPWNPSGGVLLDKFIQPDEDLLISNPLMSLTDFSNEHFHRLIGEMLFLARHAVCI